MAVTGILIDSNLLTLWVVGLADTELIGRHKRLKEYEPSDFMLLEEQLASRRVYVTPNTVTETYTLLNTQRDSSRSLDRTLIDTLRYVILMSVELVAASRDVVRRPEFRWLGLTDAAMLSLLSVERPILTVDSRLHDAAQAILPQSAINFNHHRV